MFNFRKSFTGSFSIERNSTEKAINVTLMDTECEKLTSQAIHHSLPALPFGVFVLLTQFHLVFSQRCCLLISILLTASYNHSSFQCIQMKFLIGNIYRLNSVCNTACKIFVAGLLFVEKIKKYILELDYSFIGLRRIWFYF